MRILPLLIFCTFNLLWGDLKIITNEEPPQNYTENGQITGIGTDIVKEIQKRVQDRSQIEVYPWARAVAISKRNPNTILFLAGKTKDREPYYTFIGPILAKNYKLYGKANKNYNIDNIEDAKNIEKISCVMDDVREIFMREKGFFNLIYAEDHLKALQIVLAGKSDLWASSDWESSIQMKSINQAPKKIQAYYTLYKNFNYIAINKKTDPKIIQNWQNAFHEIKQDGTMTKIAKKWSKKLGLNLQYNKTTQAIEIIE